MCLECQGFSRADVLRLHRRRIAQLGWSSVHVEPARGEAGLSYTIGLTRHHGHPELLVSGLDPHDADALFGAFHEQVRAGERYRAGDLVDADEGQHLWLLAVSDPLHLVLAQEVYAGLGPPVPALQAVWSDRRGNWPWRRGRHGDPQLQALFGEPPDR